MGEYPRYYRLIRKLSSEIQQSGPISFAQFMEVALFDPMDGYYMVMPDQDQMDGSEPSRIGWRGDFYTAPCLQPLLAKSLVRQLLEVDQFLGRPDEFTLLEMGPGEGQFARDILSDCGQTSRAFFHRLHYILIERSPSMVAKQQAHLRPWLQHGARVSWVSSLNSLIGGEFEGAFVSNELVDAFPVHRVRIENSALKEIFVDYDGDRFVEKLGNPSSPALEAFLRNLNADLPEGFTTEINLQAIEWMKNVARVLKKGIVLTIDYGHTAKDYFSPTRCHGTLLCYIRHRVNTNPYQNLGSQDITAHVNFTSLAVAGQEAGLVVTGFTNLQNFLMGLGLEDMVEGMGPESPVVQTASQLLRAEGMGGTFKILIQHKGMDPPPLSGLQYRPFFEDALMGVDTNRMNPSHIAWQEQS